MVSLQQYLVTSLQHNITDHIIRAGIDSDSVVHVSIYSRDHGGASVYYTIDGDTVTDYDPESLIVVDPTRSISRSGLLQAVQKLPGNDKIGTEKLKEGSPNQDALPIGDRLPVADPATTIDKTSSNAVPFPKTNPIDLPTTPTTTNPIDLPTTLPTTNPIDLPTTPTTTNPIDLPTTPPKLPT